MQGFVLHNRDGAVSFDLFPQHENPCVYFESNILEFSSSNGVRLTFRKIAVLLQEMCMIFTCSPTWDGIYEAMYFEDEFLRINLSVEDEYYEKKCFVHISNEMWIVCHYNWKKLINDQARQDTCSKYGVHKLINDIKLHFQRFHLFVFSTIFVGIFEYKIFEYLFLCSFIKNHSDDISFQRLGTVNYENDGNKLLSTADRYIEGDFKLYFNAGGRHQTAIKGEIVCKYLQTRTDANLLNDDLHFEGKIFDFKGYQLSNAFSIKTLAAIDPLYYSKIPLKELSDYLNTKELRDIGALHNIYIPYHIDKNTMLGLFSEHQCTQCELYVRGQTKKRRGKNGRKKRSIKIPT